LLLILAAIPEMPFPALSLALTCPATAATSAGSAIGVFWRELVALFAMSSGLQARTSLAAHVLLVLFRSTNPKVIDIAAKRYVAFVTNEFPSA
jgi:hypothetical protein